MEKQVLFDLRNFGTGAEIVNSILSEEFRIIASGGGIRGGKTYNNIGGLVLMHKRYPHSRSVIIRETLDILKKNTLPVCEKVIPKNFVHKFNGSDFSWKFKNGSEMFFMSENYYEDKNLDRFNGLEINYVFLEQMEELQEATFEKALERAGSYMLPQGYKQPKPMVLGTVNPTALWPKSVIYEPWKNDTLAPTWKYIPALLDGNPHIDASFKEALEELKRKNPKKYLQYVTGNWDVIDKTGGEYYYNFNVEIHTGACKQRYNPELPLHIVYDFNYRPYITLLVYQVQGNDILQLEEICMPPPGNTARNVTKKFAQKYNEQAGMINIYGDYSAKNSSNHEENLFDGIFAEIRNAGFRMRDCVTPNPGVSIRGEFINEVLLSGETDWRLIIDDTCKNTIGDLFSVQKKADGTKHKVKATDPKTRLSYEEKGHCSDAFDYFICEILKDLFNAYKQRAKKQTIVVEKASNLMRW